MKMVLLLFLLAGCSKGSDLSFATLISDKPLKVAFAPVIDRSGSFEEKHLSDEFTASIASRLKGFLPAKIESQKPQVAIERLFSQDLAWASKAFTHAHFAVMVQIVEHRATEYELTLAAKLRIVDLRSGVPKLLLDNVIPHMAPLAARTQRTKWQEAGYRTTPVGMAHLKFSRIISRQVEETLTRAIKTTHG